MNKAMSLVMNMLHFLVLFCLCHTFNFCSLPLLEFLHSVLWRCWLGGRKGIRPVKTDRWGTGMAICLEQGADLHMAQLMPLPLTVSCFSKIQIGFIFLVPAHPGSPRQRAVKRVYVCMYIVWAIALWLFTPAVFIGCEFSENFVENHFI